VNYLTLNFIQVDFILQNSHKYLFVSIFLLSFISAVISKCLTSVSGTRLNIYFKKKGRKIIGSKGLEALEDCGNLFICIDRIARIVLVGFLAWWFCEESLSPVDITLIVSIFLVVVLLFLEVFPNVISRIFPELLIIRFRAVLCFLGYCFRPVIKTYEGMVNFFVRLTGSDVLKHMEQAVEEEILSAVEEGEREGLIKRGGKDMIESIISFYDVEVKEVMTPRTSMVCFAEHTSFEDGIHRARKCGHSRIPVYRDNKDNIIGILYVKDFLKYLEKHEEKEKNIESILRKAYFVPESKKVSELFQEFRSQRFHIAIVLDEYGGTLGLITIEDILEEIVGEIADEFEVQKDESENFRRINDKMAEVNGVIHVDELNEFMGLELPENDSYETIAGFLFTRWGRIPSVGERLCFENLNFEIIEADERRIKRIRIKKITS